MSIKKKVKLNRLQSRVNGLRFRISPQEIIKDLKSKHQINVLLFKLKAKRNGYHLKKQALWLVNTVILLENIYGN